MKATVAVSSPEVEAGVGKHTCLDLLVLKVFRKIPSWKKGLLRDRIKHEQRG